MAKKARRRDLLAAAKLALNYGAYTFEEALALPSVQRQVLLQVADIEEEQKWFRIERVLGTLWTRDDFQQVKGGNSSEPKSVMRASLAYLINPAVAESIKKELGGNRGATQSSSFLELSAADRRMFANAKNIADMSPEEAMNMFKQSASIPVPHS